MIDLGCLPDTPFPHLEEAVQALKAAGYAVSVDSGDPGGAAPRRARRCRLPAEPDEDTLELAFETEAVPVLIPARHGELDGLVAMPASGWRTAGRAVPRRPDPRPDPFRLHRTRSCATTSCAGAARGRDADGRRQPHRADRRRHDRHHHDPDGHGLRAGDPQHPGGPGQPALPRRGRRGRAGAAHHASRPRPTAACRRATIRA